MEASSQDATAGLKSRDSSDFRLLPDRLLSEDSSEEDEVYTESLTSHTTASDSTIGNFLPLWVLFHPEWKNLT